MKQLESRSVTVGDNIFYIRPLPAFTAANMGGKLAALMAPVLGGLIPMFAGGSSDKNLMDIDIEEASPYIGDAFSGISGDKIEEILRHLLINGRNISVQTPDDEKAKLLTEDLANELFCEEVQDMFLLAFEVIRTNYSGFFGKLKSQFGPAIRQTMTQLMR